MRLITASFVGLLTLGTLAFPQAKIAVAQMPPATAPAVPIPERPSAAIEGTIASLDSRGATLQTPDGQSVRLTLSRGSYLLVDPSPQALATGMRVFAVGFPRGDGSIAVAEIDVLVPLNLLSVVPAPAQK